MNARRILLVSGPSGGGKSTFIRQLADGTLDPEIISLMPGNACTWPVIEANDVLKGDVSLDCTASSVCETEGLLVHYDIVFIHRYGIRRYEDDPASGMFERADSLHVVFVRPDGEVVRKQFLDRQARHQRRKSTASLLWGRFFRHPLRRLFSIFTGKRALTTEHLYCDDKWLAGCYRQWDTYIRGLTDRLSDAEWSIVEPASVPGNPEGFRLVASSRITSSRHLQEND